MVVLIVRQLHKVKHELEIIIVNVTLGIACVIADLLISSSNPILEILDLCNIGNIATAAIICI